MSRTTTTLLEIIISELSLSGKNEFFNNDQLTFFNDKFSFIKKSMNFDNDVEKIVNDKFFLSQKLSNNIADTSFKKMFINKFLNREIFCQTMEVFASEVTYLFMSYERFLNSFYNEYDKFLSATSMYENNSENTNKSKNRNATQDLPQDVVNIDLNNDVFEFATNNSIGLSNYLSNSENNGISKNFNIDNLLKLRDILNDLLDEFDKKCFLQVFS